jgi:hypothetical protein
LASLRKTAARSMKGSSHSGASIDWFIAAQMRGADLTPLSRIGASLARPGRFRFGRRAGRPAPDGVPVGDVVADGLQPSWQRRLSRDR